MKANKKKKRSKVSTQAKKPCDNKPASPLKSDKDLVEIRCEHRVMPEAASYFELVPNAAKKLPYKDTVEVNWKGPHKPAKLQVTELGDIMDQGIFSIPFKASFNSNKWLGVDPIRLTCELLREMYTYDQVKQYTIFGLPNGNLPIKFYNPETWKVKFQFPELVAIKKGIKVDSYKDGDVKVSKDLSSLEYESDYAEIEYKSKTISKKMQSAELDVNLDVKRPKISAIEISRNGAPLKVSVYDSIQNFLLLLRSILNICEDIKNFAPQAGWYFDASLELMKGRLEIGWGWKEYEPIVAAGAEQLKSHQSVYKIDLQTNIVLIGGEIEIGIGVRAPGFLAQVFVKLDGKVALNQNESKSAPNESGLQLSISTQFKGEIKGSGGVRVQVGYVYKLEMVIESSLEIEGRLIIYVNSDDPIRLEGKSSFSGIVGRVSQSVGFENTFAEKKTSDKAEKPASKGTKIEGKREIGDEEGNKGKVFLPGKELCKFCWPSDEKAPDYELMEEEILEMLKDMLNGKMMRDGNEDKTDSRQGLKFTYFKKSGFYTMQEEYMKADDIALWIWRKAKHYKILKTRKSMEGLCYSIRGGLEKLVINDWYRMKYIVDDDLLDFIQNGALADICKDNVDPILQAFSPES